MLFHLIFHIFIYCTIFFVLLIELRRLQNEIFQGSLLGTSSVIDVRILFLFFFIEQCSYIKDVGRFILQLNPKGCKKWLREIFWYTHVKKLLRKVWNIWKMMLISCYKRKHLWRVFQLFVLNRVERQEMKNPFMCTKITILFHIFLPSSPRVWRN